MKKVAILMALVWILLNLFKFCSSDSIVSFVENPYEKITVKLGKPGTQIPEELQNGKILVLTPAGKEEAQIETVEELGTKTTKKITGVVDFAVQSADKPELIFKVTGDIQSILVEQDVDGDKISAARLIGLEGEISYQQVTGENPSDWYKNYLMKGLDEPPEDPEAECEEDEDCEKLGIPSWPPYVLACIEGVCRFVLPGD